MISDQQKGSANESYLLKTKNPYRIRVYRYGAKGARTPDLYAASVALSQLSYGPVCNVMFIIDDFFLKNKLFLSN